MNDVTIIGLDLAKHVFQAYGADAEGAPLFNRKLRRAEVLRFFEKLPPCLVGWKPVQVRRRRRLNRLVRIEAIVYRHD